MLRYAAIGFLALLVVGAVSGYQGYADTVYVLDRANALLNRGETSGFAEDLIGYAEAAQTLIPRSGNPVWFFPTDRTDFGKIHSDLKGIIARTELLKPLPRNGEAYQQGMDDLRGKLRTMQAQIGEAMPYFYVSVPNMILAAVWVASQIAIVIVAFRIGRRTRRSSSGETEEE